MAVDHIEQYSDSELRKTWREARAELKKRGGQPTRLLILLAYLEKEIVRRFIAQEES